MQGNLDMATTDKSSVFATGPSGTSAIDSLTTSDGSIWAEYGNGADSTGKSGSSTIVQYGSDGTALTTDTIAGSVDGLKTDPVTGQVWALINQDGNSQLSLIDPTTGAVSAPFNYAVTSATRGYDDVAFTNGQVYLSYTNPANPGDPVLQQLSNGNTPQGNLIVTNLLSLGDTGTNIATGKTEAIPLSDPDSLKSISGGGLVQTSEADDTFVIFNDPGTKAQSERFDTLTGVPAGSLDDVVVPTSSSGTFYVSNAGTNQIEAFHSSNLNTSDAYASVGDEIVQVDLQTGAQTVLVSGLSKSHGMIFTPDAVTGPVVQSTSIFATGSEAGGATQPDSVTLGDNSVFVEYGNGADSTGLLPDQGSSTIVQYDMQGRIEHTTSLPGQVDGLKYDPSTGDVFALKNQDANSNLYLINPNTQAVSGPLSYAPPYVYGADSTRGFDDVAFQGGNVYLSYTNPANTGDSVIAQLDQGNDPSGALTLTSVVRLGDTGTNLVTGAINQPLPVADPDSLKTLPDGSLILTSDHDASLTIVANPGTTQQSASFVNLPAGSSGLDDAIVPTSASGTFYISNDGADDVLKVAVAGLNQNDIYVAVGSDNAIDQLDPTTGALTPFIVGLNSPHGMEFVPSTGSAPVVAGATGSGFAALVNSLAPSLVGDLSAGQLNQLAGYASALAHGGSDVQPPSGGANFAAVTQIVGQLNTLFPPHTA